MKRFLLLFIVILSGGWLIYSFVNEPSSVTNSTLTAVPEFLSSGFPDTDFSKSSVDLSQILSGGPGKDGIPAITSPEFTSFVDRDFEDSALAIVLAEDDQVKVYPYNILVWHEIVNDTFNGQDVAVTFCPLCGSALVFDRNTSLGTSIFKVSGALLESNMIMYDSQSESLWQQSTGLAVAGKLNTEALNQVAFQLMTIKEIKANYSNAQVLSERTGFSRDYQGNPYSGYDETEQLYFNISNNDQRFPAKKIFLIVPTDTEYLAVPWLEIDSEIEYSLTETDLTLTKNEGVVEVRDANNRLLPFYFEMWFSWAVQHQSDGRVPGLISGK